MRRLETKNIEAQEQEPTKQRESQREGAAQQGRDKISLFIFSFCFADSRYKPLFLLFLIYKFARFLEGRCFSFLLSLFLEYYSIF